MDANGRRGAALRRLGWLGLAAILISSSGATCMPWAKWKTDERIPIAFQHTPTMGEVIQKVNQNTASIRQLQADAVRIAAPGAPSLKATLALERPRNLRIRGELLMSRELDIGSNDTAFWIWGKNATGALLHANHDAFAMSPTSESLPIDPDWLLDALGLASFDPNAQHSGPYAHGPGSMEIHSQFVNARGEPLVKVTVVHSVYGWILEQQVRDRRNRVIAAAKASNHRHYPEAGATLPDLVEIQIAPGSPAAIDLRIDVGGYRINELAPTPDLFAIPAFDDYPHINLADPRAYDQWRGLTGNGTPTAARDEAFQPEYRGYTRK
ncbi:MAG: hypothetical protein FJ297_10900 [Planctomycetes bacterium]|nr:hypothetical protein [Planctomycetota bacterium]